MEKWLNRYLRTGYRFTRYFLTSPRIFTIYIKKKKNAKNIKRLIFLFLIKNNS